MRLLNLTPHAVVIETTTGERVTIPPSGQTVRVEATYERLDAWPLDGTGAEIPIYTRRFGALAWPDEAFVDEHVDAHVIASSLSRAAASELPRHRQAILPSAMLVPGELIREPADDSARQALIAEAEALISDLRAEADDGPYSGEEQYLPTVEKLLAFVREHKPEPGRVVACRGLVAGAEPARGGGDGR